MRRLQPVPHMFGGRPPEDHPSSIPQNAAFFVWFRDTWERPEVSVSFPVFSKPVAASRPYHNRGRTLSAESPRWGGGVMDVMI